MYRWIKYEIGRDVGPNAFTRGKSHARSARPSATKVFAPDARARAAVSIFLDSRERIFRLMSQEGKWSAVYDRFAQDYDRRMRPLERVGLRRLRARTLAEVPEGSRVLEVGAGTGLN